MLQGNSASSRTVKLAAVLTKIFIVIVVIAAVGSAISLMIYAVQRDRAKQRLENEAPALMKENLRLIKENQ